MYDWRKDYTGTMKVGCYVEVPEDPEDHSDNYFNSSRKFHMMFIGLIQAANVIRFMVDGAGYLILEDYILVDLETGEEYIVHEEGSYDNWKGYMPRPKQED